MQRFNVRLNCIAAVRLDAHDRFDPGQTPEEKARGALPADDAGEDRPAHGLSRQTAPDIGRFSACATTRSSCSTSRARSAPSIARRLDTGKDRPADQRRARAVVHAARALDRRSWDPYDGLPSARTRRGARPRRVENEWPKLKSHQATDDLAQIRESASRALRQFPGEYWRALDRERAYPTEFVSALTKAGFLAALIPEQYGGSGLPMTAAAAIMEEIQASGCNGAPAMPRCTPWARCCGTAARHRRRAGCRASRRASCGCRPSASPSRPRARTRSICAPRRCARRPLRHQRPEDLDLARRAFRSPAAARRTTPREQAKSCTGGSLVFLVDMRLAQGTGISINPIRTMMNHATTELFFDDLRVPRRT